MCSWKDRAHTVDQDQSQQNSERHLTSAYSHATVTIDFTDKKKFDCVITAGGKEVPACSDFQKFLLLMC